MEARLSALFDYQKFEKNSALQRVIDSVHTRYEARELTLDEMATVSAAGNAAMKFARNSEGDRDAGR